MTGRGAPCSRPAVTAAQLGGPHWVLGPVLFLPLPRAPPKDTRASGTCVRDPSWVTCRVPRTRRSTRGSGRPPAPEVVSRDLLMPTLTARALVTGPRGSPPRGRGTGTCGQVRPGPRELLVCAQVAPAGSAQTPLHPAAHLLRGPRGPPGDRSPPATPLGLGSGQRTPRPLPSDPVPSPRIPRGPSLEAGQRQRAVSKQEVRADRARRGPEVLQPKRREPAGGGGGLGGAGLGRRTARPCVWAVLLATGPWPAGPCPQLLPRPWGYGPWRPSVHSWAAAPRGGRAWVGLRGRGLAVVSRNPTTSTCWGDL